MAKYVVQFLSKFGEITVTHDIVEIIENSIVFSNWDKDNKKIIRRIYPSDSTLVTYQNDVEKEAEI